MKHTLFFALPFLLLVGSCGSLGPAMGSASLEASVNIEVECRNDAGTRSMVMTLLRRGRAKDVREDLVGYVMQIRASYYLADNSPQKLEEIGSLLTTQGGVFHVEIVENHSVVKDPR